MKKQASTTHFFYQNGKLVTVNQGGQQRAIFRTADMPLAEQQADGTNGLLATDRSNSVLAVEDGEEEPGHRFTPYGHDPTLQPKGAMLGFNGEAFEPATTCYQLGNGYRAYSPSLMRFHSPDSWSPFRAGGLNSYTYCVADPINRSDPSGHMFQWLMRIFLPRTQKQASHAIIEAGQRMWKIASNVTSIANTPPNYISEIRPPNYIQIMKDFTTKQTISAQSTSSKHSRTDSPPIFTSKPTRGQRTLNANLSGRDITSPITELQHDEGRLRILRSVEELGLDANGVPLPGISTDAMFDNDELFNGYRLDSLALHIRLARSDDFRRS